MLKGLNGYDIISAVLGSIHRSRGEIRSPDGISVCYKAQVSLPLLVEEGIVNPAAGA
jgi:hypothetical protein